MNSKVVSITTARVRTEHFISAIQMSQGLQALWVSGGITSDAFMLGMHAAGAMIEANAREVALRPESAFRTKVYVHGKVYAGPLFPMITEQLTWIQAAQSLHFGGRMLSHYDLSALSEPGCRDTHFTRTVGRDAKWGMETPVYFALPEVTPEEYSKWLDEVYTRNMQHVDCAVSLT